MVSDGCLLEQTGRTETDRERHQHQLAHRYTFVKPSQAEVKFVLTGVTGTRLLVQRGGGKVQSRLCSLGSRLEHRALLQPLLWME